MNNLDYQQKIYDMCERVVECWYADEYNEQRMEWCIYYLEQAMKGKE